MNAVDTTDRVHLSVAREGVDEIRIPGERAYRDRARLTREGLEIDRRIHDALIQLAEAGATHQGATP